MKKIFFGIILLSFFLISCGNNLKWEDNLQAALEKAKQENKAVLVNFTGSDWCIWCKRLSDEVFTQSDFKTYADKNLILVMIDFPRDKEQSSERGN